MRKWGQKIQNLFTAVTFAEAGEHQTALQMMGETPKPETKRATVHDWLTAITFAEAGCHDLARDWLDPRLPPQAAPIPAHRPITVQDFAASVGLQGINFRFGLAQA